MELGGPKTNQKLHLVGRKEEVRLNKMTLATININIGKFPNVVRKQKGKD